MKYICFLQRGDEVSLRKLQPQEAAPLLLRQVLMPKEPEQIIPFLKLLDRLANRVQFFLLTCNMENEEPGRVWEEMRRGE